MGIVQAGKFEGRTFDWIIANEIDYLKWLCQQPAGNMHRFFDLIHYAITEAGVRGLKFKVN